MVLNELHVAAAIEIMPPPPQQHTPALLCVVCDGVCVCVLCVCACACVYNEHIDIRVNAYILIFV